ALDGNLVEHELECYVSTRTFVELVNEQAIAPAQEGDDGTSSGAITIGWGLHDRLCLPMQALRAQAAFPKARLHWFDNAGHYPAWDSPEETVRSEEHTSELQSRENLVCRLLLEKK